jgi:ketosteroid isomerase-like protein
MSRENVEIVRGAFEALNAGDLESALTAMDPEVHWTTSIANPEGPVIYHGLAGLRQLWTLLREDFEEIRMEPDEIRVAGDAVVVLGRVGIRGRGSGAVTQSRRAWTVTLHERKITAVRTYTDHGEALQASGLRE